MTSCFQKNGFGSNGIDSLGCWHVEPHWRLVHISDVDQTKVLASPRSNHKRLEAGDLLDRKATAVIFSFSGAARVCSTS